MLNLDQTSTLETAVDLLVSFDISALTEWMAVGSMASDDDGAAADAEQLYEHAERVVIQLFALDDAQILSLREVVLDRKRAVLE